MSILPIRNLWPFDSARSTRCSYQTAAGEQTIVPSSVHRRDFTVTFNNGHRTTPTSTFVQGTLPDKLDIWRIRPAGGATERITSHNARVSHPVFVERRTLMYLASDSDGSGPWLYSLDVERRIAHRLSSGLDRYTSLAASTNGRRLVATLESPKKALWRLRLTSSPAESSTAVPIALTTGTGFAPRLGPDYLLYVAAAGTSEGIWKVANGRATELWKVDGAQIVGGPTISPDGKSIAFSIHKADRASLWVMQADGTNARIVTDVLDPQGAPALGTRRTIDRYRRK